MRYHHSFRTIGAAILCAVVALAALLVAPARAAGTFADPAFERQWREDEAIAPNFWGPLATAGEGRQEPYEEARQKPYGEAQEGLRIVQYFDKGRMELTNGVVTNGLLGVEIVTGRIQIGDATFQGKPPPTIPIAGDFDNPGPTYAQLSGRARALLDAATQQRDGSTQVAMSGSGELSAFDAGDAPYAGFAAYDAPTRHNVPKAFADYRAALGIATIGLAISEPFSATIKVANQQRMVMIQVFERRVLTYTASNPAPYKVESGNIGRDYFRWRYGAPPQDTA